MYSSSGITAGQASRIIDAARYALCSRYPLTEMMTIHLKQAKLPKAFTRKLFKLMTDWLRYQTGSGARFIWVIEAPPLNENGHGGLHVHVLVHLPIHLRNDLRRLARKWIRLAGGQCKAGVLHFQRIYGSETGMLAYYLYSLLGALRYLLKGIDRGVASGFGIRPFDQGLVVRKRVGYSQSLGPARRWQPQPVSYRPGIIIDDVARAKRQAMVLCPEMFEPNNKACVGSNRMSVSERMPIASG